MLKHVAVPDIASSVPFKLDNDAGDATFAGTAGTTTTVQGNEVVVTIGRLGSGSEQTVSVPVTIAGHGRLEAFASVTSATALPVFTNVVSTIVSH